MFAIVATVLAGSQVLIGGGGAKPEDAQRWIDGFNQRMAAAKLAKLVKLADGFPRAMKSDELPGLKPGLHIAVLGSCSDDEGPGRAAALRLLDAGTYARASTAAPLTNACPTVDTGAFKAAGYWAPPRAAAGPKQTWSLVTAKDGSDGTVLLLAENDVLLDFWRVPELHDDTHPLSCSPSATAGKQKGTLAVEQDCQHDVQGNGAYCTAHVTQLTVLKADKGKVKASTADEVEHDPVCGGE